KRLGRAAPYIGSGRGVHPAQLGRRSRRQRRLGRIPAAPVAAVPGFSSSRRVARDMARGRAAAAAVAAPDAGCRARGCRGEAPAYLTQPPDLPPVFDVTSIPPTTIVR